MTLRSALGCSAAFHVVLLIARSPLGLLPFEQALHPIEVSYLPVKVPEPVSAVAEPKRMPPVPAGNDDGGSFPVFRRPSPLPVPAERPVPRPTLRPAVHRWTEVAPLPLPADTSRMSRQEFAFVEHKERVRRHLKARLHYPAFLCAEARGGASSSAGLSDGTVRIRLLLDPQGALKQAIVLETSDPRLASIAVQDAQGAAPYPRFPGVHHPRQLRYEYLVRYKPE